MSGVELFNNSTENAELPSPLAGVMLPGQKVIINSTSAILALFGIAGGPTSTLQITDLPSYTGPYATLYQGALNADGSVTGQSTLPDFGDGVDGSVVFDGVATVLGLAPSTNVYTLTRDIYPKNMTVNSGVTIITAGFRIVTSQTLTNNGTISWDGNAAALGVAGAALSAGTVGGSFAGGAGGAAAANGAAGTNATASGGGTGGAGGAGTGGGTAGAASTVTAPTAAQGGLPHATPFTVMGQSLGNGGLTLAKGGAGGSGGSGDGTGTGGGGGGGGGVIVIAARTLVNAGAIHARGGAGGAGGATNCGGGGGGGGGYILVTSRSITGAGTIDANGGAAGAKAGSGAAGSAGGAGTVEQLVA